MSGEQLPAPWGVLVPLDDAIPEYELREEETSFGRLPTVSYNLTKLAATDAGQYTPSYSRLHYVITRREPGGRRLVRDTSVYGTFINGNLIGKDKEKVLNSGDVISLVHPINEVFVYISTDCGNGNTSILPKDLRDKYILSKRLSRENRTELRLGFIVKSWRKCMVKIIQKLLYNEVYCEDENAQQMQDLAEIRVLNTARNCPFLINAIDIHDMRTTSFIVLPYLSGGNLLKLLQKRECSEAEAKMVMYQLSEAVRYLHGRGIAHRDIKPENVLLTSFSYSTLMKLSNFTSSLFTGSREVADAALDPGARLSLTGGTAEYMAPEVLTPRRNLATAPLRRVTPGLSSALMAADCWSLGITLYQCLSGMLPADSEHVDLDGGEWAGVSHDGKQLVTRLLAVRPHNRYSIYDVGTHPWMQDPSVKATITELLNDK